MSDDPKPEFDLSRPQNRYEAPTAAIRNGIMAALKGDARWSVLCSIFEHLPQPIISIERIVRETGLARSTVMSARKRLKAAGLIHYADGQRGGVGQLSPLEVTTHFQVIDVRNPTACKQIIERLATETKPKNRLKLVG